MISREYYVIAYGNVPVEALNQESSGTLLPDHPPASLVTTVTYYNTHLLAVK